MWYILEIVIIILAGLAAAAFLARYFFISSGTKKQTGCSGCNNDCARNHVIDKNEIFAKKILENNKKIIRKV